MGWFSAKKTTYVSSVVYPLGDDSATRTDVLKNTMLNANLQQTNGSEALRNMLVRGQGISLRSAFRYARDKYSDGLPASAARFSEVPDLAPLTAILQPLHHGSEIKYVATVIGTADYEWWAEQHLAKFYGYDRTLKRFMAPPKDVEPDANVAYDLEPNGHITILLMNADGAVTSVDYKPEGYVRMANYVHCAYQTKQLFTGETTVTTRDAAVGESDSTVYASVTVDRTGETQITTSKTAVVVTGSQAMVTVSNVIDVLSRPKYFLYQLGTEGYPDLDLQLTTVAAADVVTNAHEMHAPYFPSVPLRIQNTSMLDVAHKKKALYKTSKILLKKVGLDFDDLGKQVDTNPSVSDIDFCYVTFGVRLNTGSPEGKKYLFRFFDYLRDISSVTPAQYKTWETAFDTKFPTGPKYKMLPDEGVQAPPVNSVEIYSAKSRSDNHDIKLQWQYIDTRLVSGTVSTGARPGTVTVLMGSGQIQRDMLNEMVLDSSILLVRKQIDSNTYVELEIAGLVYENFIYQGKSVIVTAHDAMTNVDEEGFIIPLNQQILRQTPLIELTNLSYQCMFMVFNSYTVVKQKWYQTGWFKVILVIIVIVVVALSMGSAAPAAGSMMSLAYGAAAGMVGIGVLTAYLAATMYVLALMVVSSILMKVSTKVFGAKWGPIIAAIVMVIGMNYANTGNIMGATANSSSSLITAPNIIQASSALSTAYFNSQITGISKELEKLASDYKTGMAKVEDLTKANLSTSLGMIDVQGLTDSSYTLNYELPDTFLNRTLLTGSDVAEITSGLVENFADVGLRLPTTG